MVELGYNTVHMQLYLAGEIFKTLDMRQSIMPALRRYSQLESSTEILTMFLA